jgi:hypothetical protein
MMYFKDAVRLSDLARPQLVLAMVLADQVYDSLGVVECWITSINDSVHGTNSKHYRGEAFDMRSKNLTTDQKILAHSRLRAKLGPLGYDVLLEDLGGSNEHFHIEWDPKYE